MEGEKKTYSIYHPRCMYCIYFRENEEKDGGYCGCTMSAVYSSYEKKPYCIMFTPREI